MKRGRSRNQNGNLLSKFSRNIILATTVLIGSSIASLAADAVAPQPEIQDQQRWRVVVSPYLWGASLNGSAGLLGRSTDVHMPFSEIFDNLDMGLMGNVDISNGTFGFFIDGQYVKTSQEENLRDNELSLDITTTSLSGGAYYRIYEQQLEGTTLFGNQRVFAIEPTIGVRWTKLEAGLEVGRFSGSRKVEWTDPFVGTRVFYDINDRWNIFAEADIGGFGAGTKLSANGQIYLGYRTLVFDVPTTFRVGYRALYQDYKDNDTVSKFKYDVTQHGPVVGFSVSF
ncbi:MULTISPECIES: hypothetical protein [Brucella/Ochrobactrum group]|uniref:Outer membrane protein beta-barrel domain-containing protein n=1 Tax=Brucella pseudintermedia TaxID=370111 RepID=A0ABY5UCR6_9HYPH|nr:MULTISPECIES: hypothetical protein [Brucella/Ochrobactrum group]MCO7725642.1 hypothetical protein [Brucella intermedia]NKE76816.1 hypothetical protein [Ochrobactrum sp. MC-1LL]KAB2685322.1 hypothetical protein F9K78_00990 [Brucella pseudintermedia]TWG98836.1 hypothetical protein L614_000400001910 [Ochrobactrum sp. J50]UWL61130.1 hypothetical protein NIK97_05075 [Brucella pseudintermedia]